MPDDTLSTLEQIRNKVRRLTRALDENQLSTDQLDDYINTFVLYDFPEHLRLFNLKETFTFFTQPYIDVYDTNTTVPTDPMYNFANKYVTVQPPVYIAGYQALWSQSREQMFSIYPMTNSIASVGSTGDGATVTFTGNINTNVAGVQGSTQGSLILRSNVLFSSIDTNGNSLALIDYPDTPTTGYLAVPNQGADEFVNQGSINYVTGNFTITFPTAPASGAAINSQTILVQPSLPQAILFFDGTFTVRPVPDQAYRVVMDAYVRPTELFGSSAQPKLSEWWQYIAYGAAKKVFEDRSDIESVSQLMPEFKKQELLVQRRTLVQLSNQRTSTIYTQQTEGNGSGYRSGSFGGGGNF